MIEEIKNNLNKPIVFVGLMGAGKSTIGQDIAHHLNINFMDSDRVIEACEGKTIEDIFAAEGEAYFRDLERQTIERLLSQNSAFILGVGGGAYIDAQTRALIQDKAICIFLKTDVETLKDRVGSGEGRPLFKGKEVEQVLNDLIEQRYPIYTEADIVIESHDEDIKETAQKVITALYNHLCNE